MKKIVAVLLLVFYLLGILLLPMGDFGTLADLPEMYKHCKATEDKDMTALDFITDHLINIDGMFDKHDNGDEQKPHSPRTQHHNGQASVFYIIHFAFTIKNDMPLLSTVFLPTSHFYPSDYYSKIFRPPIFA